MLEMSKTREMIPVIVNPTVHLTLCIKWSTKVCSKKEVGSVRLTGDQTPGIHPVIITLLEQNLPSLMQWVKTQLKQEN